MAAWHICEPVKDGRGGATWTVELLRGILADSFDRRGGVVISVLGGRRRRELPDGISVAERAMCQDDVCIS